MKNIKYTLTQPNYLQRLVRFRYYICVHHNILTYLVGQWSFVFPSLGNPFYFSHTITLPPLLLTQYVVHINMIHTSSQ